MSRAPRAVLAVVVAAALLAAVVAVGDRGRRAERAPTPSAGPRGGDLRPAPTAPGPEPGTVRLGVPEEPASLNPFDPRSRTAAGVAILGEVLPQLFRVDADGRPRGFLVDDATVREGPGVVSFSLHSGARWSDGTAITGEDILFTLEAIRSDAWPGPRAGYDHVTGVDGRGAEVVLRFDQAAPGWRRLFSGEDFLLPAHRLRGKDLRTEWAQGPDLAGGPFSLTAVTPGLEVVLERNGRWWGTRPGLERLRVLVVPDDRTMEQLLAAKQLEVAWPPATTHRIARLRALSGVDVSVAKPGGALVSLMANADKLTREQRAALLGLPDRDRFVEVLLGGEAALATSLVPGADGGAWLSAPPDRGRPGLDGQAVDLVAGVEEPMAPLLGRILQGEARARHTTLELKFTEATGVEGEWLREGQFDLALAHQVDWPQPCWRCRFGSQSVGRGNPSRVKDLDDLTAAADAGDPGAPAKIESHLRDVGVILPMWRPSAVLASRDVKDVVANSWSIGPFWGAENWTPAG